MLCCDFILPEAANLVLFFFHSFLRILFYLTHHYFEDIEFVAPDSLLFDKAASFFANKFAVTTGATVTSDAFYRQTFAKEAAWRAMGCVGVDMESSALLSVSMYYSMPAVSILLCSDKHPIEEKDTVKLEHKREELDERLQGTFARIRTLIEKNAREAMDQDAFLAEHKSLSDRCAALLAETEKLDNRISEIRGRKASIDEYLAALEQAERLSVEFSRRLWNMTIETLTVYERKQLVFQWKDETVSECQVRWPQGQR